MVPILAQTWPRELVAQPTHFHGHFKAHAHYYYGTIISKDFCKLNSRSWKRESNEWTNFNLVNLELNMIMRVLWLDWVRITVENYCNYLVTYWFTYFLDSHLPNLHSFFIHLLWKTLFSIIRDHSWIILHCRSEFGEPWISSDKLW